MSSQYDMVSEANTSMVINHFDIDFIMDVVRDNLNRKTSIYQPGLPNIASAVESHYNILMSDNQDISIVNMRNSIYEMMLSLLCDSHGLQIDSTQEEFNMFTLTYYLYDFLISNFKQYLVGFFSFYIYKEKDNIYKAFNLSEMKKNKDSTTVYGKRMCADQKLAIINANIPMIIEGMMSFDIKFEDILASIYPVDVVSFITSHVSSINDFFKDVYVFNVLGTMSSQSLITDIRFALHSLELNNLKGVV